MELSFDFVGKCIFCSNIFFKKRREEKKERKKDELIPFATLSPSFRFSGFSLALFLFFSYYYSNILILIVPLLSYSDFSCRAHTYFGVNSTIFFSSSRVHTYPFCFPSTFLRGHLFPPPLFSYLVPNRPPQLYSYSFILIHIFTVIEFHFSHFSHFFSRFLLFILPRGQSVCSFFLLLSLLHLFHPSLIYSLSLSRTRFFPTFL